MNAGLPQFPTLEAIDLARGRGPDREPFATSEDAQFLEQRARELIDRYWSETAWLTGLVSRTRFDTVCGILEHARQVARESKVPVMVAPEQSDARPRHA